MWPGIMLLSVAGLHDVMAIVAILGEFDKGGLPKWVGFQPTGCRRRVTTKTGPIEDVYVVKILLSCMIKEGGMVASEICWMEELT